MSAPSARNSDAPSLAEIEAFTAVVAHGSFSGAAERLGVAKSSVSRRISSLETRLGARLLQRSTRRLGLTEVGERYHDQVARSMQGLRDAADSVREVQDEPQGELRITAPVDLGPLLAPLVAEFSSQFSKVELNVAFTQRRVDMVREGFDLALRAGDLQDSSLMVRRLQGGELVVFTSPAYAKAHGAPRSVEQLADHPWVLFRGQHGRMSLDKELADRDEPIVVHGSITGDEFEFVRDCVRAGAGLGIAPRFVLEQDLRAGTLIRLLPNVTLGRTALSLVYPSRRFVPAKVRAFCDFAVPWFAERLGQEAQDTPAVSAPPDTAR